MRLLSRAELPPWFDSNPFILSGYRPESRSWARSLASWTYWHNESGNIYSHLVPGLVLGLSLLVLGLDLSSQDGLVVGLQLGTALLCLFVSTLYHTALNHSESVTHLWLQFDYGGILGLILGNFLSGLHFGFYCHPSLKNLYWSMVRFIEMMWLSTDLTLYRSSLPVLRLESCSSVRGSARRNGEHCA